MVYISAMENQVYPPFLSYNNFTRELTFRPDSYKLAGETFYFTIIVKETNSDTVLYPYYCTVRVNGTVPDGLEEIDYAEACKSANSSMSYFCQNITA